MAKLTLTVVSNINSAQKGITDLKQQIGELSTSLKNIKVNDKIATQIHKLSADYAKLATAVAKVTAVMQRQQITESKVATETSRQALNEVKRQKALGQTASQVKALERRYANLISTIKNLKNAYPQGTFDSIEQSARDNLKAIQDQTGDVRKLTTEYGNLATQLATTRAETDKVTTAVVKSGDSIGSLAKKFLLWQVTATLVMQPIRALQNVLSSINETLVNTEDRVIELRRVVGDVANANELYDLAQKYGQTFENVSEATLNFARRGMSWNESLKATEAALLAINVAELDVGQSTDGLGAIMAQFGKDASELTNVVDMLNKTADNFPVTTEKILTALQRVGSTASTANLSLEETIGLITTLSKSTNRSGENIGTALNSILNISQKDSTLKTFEKLGDSVKNVIDLYRSGATGTSLLDVLEAVGKRVQELDTHEIFSNEEFDGLNEELKDAMGEDFEMLSEIYGTAGTYRRNYFIALLNDLDTVKQVESEIADAQGYSQKENLQYLDTYTARQNSVQAKWQKIANDEQGLLGIKKDLLDMGGFVLDIVQAVGGLKTALIALGVVVGTVVLSFKGEAIIATLSRIGTLLKSLTIDAIPNAIGAWKSFAKGISSAGTALQASLPLITAVIIAISALDSAIRRGVEKREEERHKALETENEAIAKSNEYVEAQKKEVAQMNEVATSIENLRKILDDSSQSEEEKTKAQNQLIKIQNSLIESNNSYKDSLDLTNGSLKEQLGLIEKLTTEQLKQKANDFLKNNKSEIEIAKNRLESSSTINTEMVFSGVGKDRHEFRDIINSAISGAGIDSVANLIEDNEYGYLHSYYKGVGEEFQKGFWNGLGALLNPFDDLWEDNGKAWTGKANAGFSFSGTVEQQIEAIEKLKTYIATNKDTLGLSAEETVSITSELSKQLDLLNSEEYQQAQILAQKAKATQDWLNGTIDEVEYLKIVYGIEKDIGDESDNWTNNIQDVTGKYDDLISSLEKLRDLEEENAAIEEKKKDYIEAQNELIKAQQALEKARNEATVRRFNEATRQWEWQVDEKKVAEAEETVKKQEESVENARKELEKQAYDTIIDQLKEQTATNDSILKIIEEVAPLLGQDFAEAVKGAIQGTTKVDIDKPIVTSEKTNANTSTKTRWNSYQDAVDAGYANIAGASPSEKGRVIKQYGSYQAYLDAMYEKYMGAVPSYDNGGIANGLGFMAKATSEPEVVLAPKWASKILDPVSNEQFDRYVKDMGIMFEQAHNWSQMPSYERISNSTDNRVDNSGQITMNGVTIGSNARGNTLDELLSMASIIPKN